MHGFITLSEVTSYMYEPCCVKTSLRGSRPILTQTGLYSHRRWLEAWNFVFSKKRDHTIYEVKTKVMISCAVTVQLICVFVFAYAKSQFSHDTAHKVSFCILIKALVASCHPVFVFIKKLKDVNNLLILF